MLIWEIIVSWILCNDDWTDSRSKIIEDDGRTVTSVCRTLWASVIISIVNAPLERVADKVETERAKEDEDALDSPDDRDNISAILSRTTIIAFRLDCKTSILYT